MKRTALLLTGVLLASLLGGCGNTEKTDSSAIQKNEIQNETKTKEEGQTEAPAQGADKEAVTISLLSWYTEEQLGAFITEFQEENPHITIDLQYVPPVQQYVDKFSVLVASGQMTDMFYTAAENKREVVDQGLAEDLSNMAVFERIDEHTAATYGKDGEVYAYSPDAWIGGIYYNKELFTQAGIEKEPATWDEFLECCKKLKDIGVEPYLDASDAVHNLPQDLYQSMVIGSDPTADEKINNGEKTFKEYYTEPLSMWYNEMVAAGLYSQISLGLNADQVIDMFANGEAAMFHGGPWNVSTIEEKNSELQYDIFGLADKEGNSVLSGAVNVGISISKASNNKDECRAFLEFMSKDENIQKWQKVTNNAIIVEGIEYSLDTVFEKFKQDAVEGNFYLPQIAWKNSAGIYKEFLAGIQDTITGADTIENIPIRLDEKEAELNQ